MLNELVHHTSMPLPSSDSYSPEQELLARMGEVSQITDRSVEPHLCTNNTGLLAKYTSPHESDLPLHPGMLPMNVGAQDPEVMLAHEEDNGEDVFPAARAVGHDNVERPLSLGAYSEEEEEEEEEEDGDSHHGQADYNSGAESQH